MNKNTKIWYWVGGVTVFGLVSTALIMRRKKKRIASNAQNLVPQYRYAIAQNNSIPKAQKLITQAGVLLPEILKIRDRLKRPASLNPISTIPIKSIPTQAIEMKPILNLPKPLPYTGSDRSPATILSTNNNALPTSFRNWNGGSSYLSLLPRGIRNNNPGNLVQTSSTWKGKLPKSQNKDKRFEMFVSPEYGIRALIKLLQNYMTKGYNTPEKIISRYAPKNENDTRSYINLVSQSLGVNANTALHPTKNTLQQLVFAIVKVENGGNYMTTQLFEKAYSMVSG